MVIVNFPANFSLTRREAVVVPRERVQRVLHSFFSKGVYKNHPFYLYIPFLHDHDLPRRPPQVTSGIQTGMTGRDAAANKSLRALAGTGFGVKNWAGSGRYRKDPQNAHRIFDLHDFLFVVLVVVCFYLTSRTWDTLSTKFIHKIILWKHKAW